MTITMPEVPPTIAARFPVALAFIAKHPRLGFPLEEIEHLQPLPKFTFQPHQPSDRRDKASTEWTYLTSDPNGFGLLSIEERSNSKFSSFVRGDVALSFHDALQDAAAGVEGAEKVGTLEILDAPTVQTSAICLRDQSEQWIFPYRLFGTIGAAPRLRWHEFESVVNEFADRAL